MGPESEIVGRAGRGLCGLKARALGERGPEDVFMVCGSGIIVETR